MTSATERSHEAGRGPAERALWGGAAVKGNTAGGSRRAEPSARRVSGTEPPAARLHHFFERSVDRAPHATALHAEDRAYTYAELDALANRLAHLLAEYGLEPGARVGLLLQRSTMLYVSLLAVLKAGGTFVPIDPASPGDRVQYIADNAELAMILTAGDHLALAEDADADVLDVEALRRDLPEAPEHRPEVHHEGDPTCYIIYTSGSTGRPKGVEVAHSSICNFIDVVPEVYDVRPHDRVYQGMTIAFDFSIEEIWPTWATGATLVAGPTGDARLGQGLVDFLVRHEITVLYCVPTVLATLDHDLPAIRSILVGGEACPADLVERWATPERRMLNTYGPTEATVTCTWGELYPGKPVTIGRAMPTYEVFVLDEDLREVPHGETGEICVAGPGVARGYVNLPKVTAERFRVHPEKPHLGRIYRTGDLGRVLPDGEIEYLGRADSEVKIRGHRADLQEIENVLRRDDAVADAAVKLVAGEDVAAFVTLRQPVRDERAFFELLHAAASASLPPYMVPAFYEVLPAMPMMVSGKVDRKALPDPTSPRFVTTVGLVPPETPTELDLTDVWSRAFRIPADQLSVEADFFLDLGGHSLLAATVASELRREHPDLDIAIADLYSYPTVRSLARHLDTLPVAAHPGPAAPELEPLRHSSARVLACGTAQLVTLTLAAMVVGAPIAAVMHASGGEFSYGLMWNLLGWGLAVFVLARVFLPLVGARVLGRFVRPGDHPLWGRQYYLQWCIDGLMRLSPLSILAGTPLAARYLRLLGAEVGPEAHVGTAAVGLPSMLRIGARASIGYGATLETSRVERGWMTIGPVEIGEGAFVGAAAMVQPEARVEDGARLAEQSLAARGQVIPAGEHWLGSPSRPGPGDELLDRMERRPFGGRRTGAVRAGYLLGWLGFEVLPWVLVLPSFLMIWIVALEFGLQAGLALTPAVGVVYVLTVCLVVAGTRALVLHRTPTGIHPVRSGLGVRKWMADRLLATSLETTNSLYATLYTSPWLRLLGAKVGKRSEVSTVGHIDPDLLVLGEGSFVADMASVGSAVYHHGHVHMERTVVGDRSFVGNAAFVPSGTRMGEGSLVGVQSVPPADVPDGTSWLGSPAIFLPRRQDSGNYDEGLTYRPSAGKVAGRLVIEALRITVPPTLIGLLGYLGLLVSMSLVPSTSVLGFVVLAPFLAAAVGVAVVLSVVLLKWAVVGRYRPRVEPLWDMFVRRSEFVTGVYESAAVPALLGGLVGTPLIGPFLRLFGARIGRRTYIGTTYLTEFDLVHIGDDASVSSEVSLQTHLFEDRVMKMSDVRIDRQASIGARAVVLYDTTVGEAASVDALSLVMKGEQLLPGTSWRGIPVRAASDTVVQAR
ncbi:amino acid adenylation domain-containing protein [Kocuria sp. LUK]|uniref:Pls/PosA family non-ribosomal peptide synthetase n=1 Tax=Kocuria sp. LUK TaxID=2897828 RepID=UPI001E4AB187|nr:Pls/PosA family non-ribosomal peptide synthetase [Kocuria sp. LUK]MCD1145518.1 amino acid adenylation domain-containing protein [Kocuria sp. LUK]